MNALAPYIAALHQQDLLEAAEIGRRARLALGSQPSIPAWRRGLGGLLVRAARSVDPGVEDRRSSHRPTDGRSARALAV